MTATLDREALLLNEIQGDIPLVARPYRLLAERAGMTEAEALAVLDAKKAEGILRQVSAIFDTRTLGYSSSLVAARHDPKQIDEGAAVVSAHPGVSHNYRRNHAYNLWYTIAVPPDADLRAHVDRLHDLSGAETTRLMPTLHLFKIGVKFDMTGTDAPDAKEAPAYRQEDRNPGYRVTELDRRLVLELQKDLPIAEEPFAGAAAALGLSVEGLAAEAERMKRAGAMRRISAVFRHQAAGFRFNAMGVWAVPQDRLEELGNLMGSFKSVSHCYLRPTYPDWPYTIFTMVHGRSVDEAVAKIDAIADEVGRDIDRAVLYSTREYKKVRLEYFLPEFYAWADEHLGR